MGSSLYTANEVRHNEFTGNFPCDTMQCMLDENRLLNLKWIIYKLSSAIMTTVIFFFTIIYVRSKGAPHNILWKILLVAFAANLFGVLEGIFLQ
jgi:hypothetical protein